MPITEAFRDLSFLILGGYFAIGAPLTNRSRQARIRCFYLGVRCACSSPLGILAVIAVMLQHHEPLKPRNNPALYPVIVMIGFLLGVVSRLYTRGYCDTVGVPSGSGPTSVPRSPCWRPPCL